MKDIFLILSPFISAILVSLVTYFLTLRTKKYEILTAQRLIAFKAIQSQLIKFRQFYFREINSGRDFIDSNDHDSDIQPIQQIEILTFVLDENLIFLSPKLTKQFDELMTLINHANNVNITNALNESSELSNNEVVYTNPDDTYKKVYEKIDSCIFEMYAILNLKH